LGSPEKQREIIVEELSEIVERYGDDRRTEIMPGFDADMKYEDLIPDEQVVVTLTRGGYIKRTRADLYRKQHRGGRGIKGAQLRSDDIVEHFFVTSTHRWLLFFTNLGRVYRAKAYEIAEAGRDAKGQHVANVLALQPDESVAQVLDIPDYSVANYLVLVTKGGMIKKTELTAYDTPRTGGVIAINLREGDEVVQALLANDGEEILLISRGGMSLRFVASSEALRPMGRATAGVKGMALKGEDEVLNAAVVTDQGYVFVVTEGGFAKRTAVDQYRPQNRGGMGIKVAKLSEQRGRLAGGLVCAEDDEVMVVLESGKVVRSGVDEVPAKGRDTMGVVFCRFDDEDRVLAVARNKEQALEEADEGSTLEEASENSEENPS
jgi:DNA gyrase subunit A